MKRPAAVLSAAVLAPTLILVGSTVPKPAFSLFQTSDRCFACHNGPSSPAGEDVSIGLDWRPTMMANSSRDPYWQAGVRRETIDHPGSAKAIEDECATCHMPMSRFQARAAGREGEIFAPGVGAVLVVPGNGLLQASLVREERRSGQRRGLIELV